MSSKTKRAVNPAADAPPLSTLLSQLLIAFTIEFDNEFEHRMPHWTTRFGLAGERTRGVWLGSMVLWANGMRLVPDEGITVAELESQARTPSVHLAGLERWGYVFVAPHPADKRPKPPQRDWLVRPTPAGRKAQGVWRPLSGEIEERWRQRFGQAEIEALRRSLSAVLARIDTALPEFLSIVGYGLFSGILLEDGPDAHGEEALAAMNLCTLLAKVLLAFTIEFEFGWKISLPIHANCLRLLGEEPIRLADLLRLSGISKEGVAFATGWLARHGYAVIAPVAQAKGKAIRLTAQGQKAKEDCAQRLAMVETRWRERFGDREIANLRHSLLALIYARDGEQSLLAQGLTPHPDGWRAKKPYLAQTLTCLEDPAASLPHQPMVLHRGGYPDGS